MKKKLDTSSITNELEQSSFFKDRQKLSSSPKTVATEETKPVKSSTNETLHVRAYGRTDDTGVRVGNLADLVPSAPAKRRPERYAFQFWEDQITRLKQLRNVVNLSKDAEYSEDVTLSDMIREAVDDYIDKQLKRLKQSVRTDG